jgi:hypothetical protein
MEEGMVGLLTEWAFRCIGELEEVDVEVDANAVDVGNPDNLSLDAVTTWHAGDVGGSAGVVLGDGGVAELARHLAESEARAG